MIISTPALKDAFQTNDMIVSFEGKTFGQLLNELGIKDTDGLIEYLITRLDTQDLSCVQKAADAGDDVALYLDGIAAGVRVMKLLAMRQVGERN